MDKNCNKVIIAGGRDFSNYETLKKACDKILVNSDCMEIVSGTARGADQLGERYAKEKGYMIKRFPADWNTHGKKAGFLRNKEMAEYADALIAFWDGSSRGTNHMINLAKQQGLRVAIVHYDPAPTV